MSTPGYYPSPNPGGQNTWAVRSALKDWIDAQHIPGVGLVRLTLQPVNDWAEVLPADGMAAIVYIDMGPSRESRAALVGSSNPGGKDISYEVDLRVVHRGMGADDWEASQQDFERIVDSLKDCLRAEGRDLGRPDIIFQAGDWPRENGIVFTPDGDPEPESEGDTVDRRGVISFIISQYLPTYIPSA